MMKTDSSSNEEKQSTPKTEEKIDINKEKLFLENDNTNEKSTLKPTTINIESSVTEDKTTATATADSIVSNTNEGKTDEHVEDEQVKYVPLERKPNYTFIMLISSQGQEVLKSKY